jgi:cyclopropane-fatty-acyl-phospholipid synthase
MTTMEMFHDRNTSQPGMVDRLFRRVLSSRLTGLKRGEILLQESAGASRLGEPADLRANFRVHHPRFFREAVLGGTMSVAESYLRGDWDSDDLTTLFRIFVRNLDAADRLDGGLSRLVSVGHRLFHWCRANTRVGSRRNIQAHYDLGNDFFRLWLDETMAYSSGIFPVRDATLHDASVEKFDRICRKLDLGPRDHVLEIGTGWGGFAVHAASRYGCRVTTTTLSDQQHRAARAHVNDCGLADRVTLLQQDYRELAGRYDKLVSIEMIEAVGHRFLDNYFRKCGELLRPDGSMVLQAIVMPERRHARYLRSVDFIQRYVFPGGCLPSVASMLESAGRSTDLRFVHAEDFAPHYAETLRRWRSAFLGRLDEVREQGYPERFIRLWNYYLCYCEALFEERYVGVVQVQFDKPMCRRDPIRLSLLAAAAQRGTTLHNDAAPSRRELSLCEL